MPQVRAYDGSIPVELCCLCERALMLSPIDGVLIRVESDFHTARGMGALGAE